MAETEVQVADAAIRHVKRLLYDAKIPLLPPELAALEGMPVIHDYIVELRTLLDASMNGDFSRSIKLRGVIAGRIKAFQANILHLIWQVQQIAKGDFTQRVEFMGELSASFNSMVVQLDNALTTLRQKEEELTRLTKMLEREVELRGEALQELSMSEARFRYLAEHDPLTGVLNRRSFSALAEMELIQVAQKDHSCCIAMLDIDFFKKFNDAYGHIEGDEAIRHTMKICQDSLRHNDLIGRYGGEEFVMLYSHADEPQGIGVAERIRATIANTPIKIGGLDVKLTVSIGLVEVCARRFVSNDERFLPFVLATADSALYKAKKQGRNQVRTAALDAYRPEKRSTSHPFSSTRVSLREINTAHGDAPLV